MAEMSNWYGSIPDTWKVVSFNQSVRRMATGLNPRENFALSKTEELYYVTIRNFKDNQLFLDDNCDRISREAWEIIQARSDLHKGDILFASISKDGQAYLLNADPINWNINESVFCIRVDEKLFNNRYFRYEITNIGFYSDLLLDATGTTFKSIKQNKLRQSKLISPLLSEQHAIADYLDTRCSKIDEIIAEATASIEEYKELKQAVIFEAVTKGLDKNALMKDSGIKGWGQIPYTWKCIRMKNLIMSISSGLSAITSDNNSDESGLYVLRTSAVSTGEFKPDEVKSVLKNAIDRLVCPVKKNTIVMSRMNTAKMVGYCAFIDKDYDGYYLPDKLWRIETQARALPKYIWYLINSNACHNHFASIATGTSASMINITINDLMSLIVAIPDVEIQQEIINYLDLRVGEMDSLISEKQDLINDLQAYKKSLIYEVVTGKRRVV